MIRLPSIVIYLLILLNLSHINSISNKNKFLFLNSSLFKLRRTSRSKFVLFEDLLEDPSKDSPLFKYESPKFAPYPYYDAPRNLFYDTTKWQEPNKSVNVVQELEESEIQKEYMRNAAIKRRGRSPPPKDTSPLAELSRAIGSDFRKYIYSDKNSNKESIKTDLGEYDALDPGFGKWPSYDELTEKGAQVDTSMFIKLDENNNLHRTLRHIPLFRNDVKTVAEAKVEQKRWLERSRKKDWSLTYKEFAAMPLEMREEYYEKRFPNSDPDEQFLMLLYYRRALEGNKYEKNPLEFEIMEDDHTYTPKDSPVLGDLKNWDDPLECGWRVRANEAISDCVSYGWPPRDIRFHSGMDVYDITWLPAVVKVVVERTRNECGSINPKELKLMLMKLEKRLEQLDKEEHTEVMKNHIIVISTKPEDSKVLHTRREWNENIGKKVEITMNDENKSKYEGVLLGSNNTFGIKIEVGDEIMILPLPFVDEVINVDSIHSVDEIETFDLHDSFLYYNYLCFDGFLERVRVSWSKRLTLSAGICQYKDQGYCEIKISESILKYRSVKECKETLVHEMIHAYLFLNNLDHERGHGKEFIWHMNRVNEITGLNVTIYHQFYDEVDYLRKHIWRCNGPCRFNPPYFGYIKRSRNKAPGPRDFWWEKHRKECDGHFIKVAGDINISNKKRVIRDKRIHQTTIKRYMSNTNTSDNDDKQTKESNSEGSSSFPIVINDN